MTLEYDIVTYEVMLDINGMDSFINKEVLSQERGYFWEEP